MKTVNRTRYLNYLDSTHVGQMVEIAKNEIEASYRESHGFASAFGGIYSGMIWTRDTALISLISVLYPKQLIETLSTLIGHQHKNGMLPIRVGWNDTFWSYIASATGIKWLRREYDIEGEPWYETSLRSLPARDTAYCAILLAFNVSQSSTEGREYVQTIIERLERLLIIEEEYVDLQDGLVISSNCSDWGDCIKRKGKLATINLLRYAALRKMAVLERSVGRFDIADEYSLKADQVLRSCMEKLWDNSRGCFTASEIDKRVDATANILASLVMPDLNNCVRIQVAIERGSRDKFSGLVRCYSEPYEWYEVSLLRTVGMMGYGNTFLYPVLTDLNILAKVRIAKNHPDKTISENYLMNALVVFAVQTELHRKLGTFHEILAPGDYEPAVHPIFRNQFQSHAGFTPAAAVYLAVYNELKSLCP